ncbi:hypothetical protein QUB80_08725 [Chlorogloeopsis sp. ULAP01]|uniref:hypothetical protein n=1 Tax=Chlorogloeopsis sp. ULAP01 TaxID=3056483 RepID=UPI0025AB24D2|nr:hypothetical protein [Chlorogloeopsis sp. ULAP01]MDM9380788.1 hypothetical protein [Chlorogloeopsis sp. ULAP01]
MTPVATTRGTRATRWLLYAGEPFRQSLQVGKAAQRAGSFMPGNPYFRLSTTLREAGLRPSTCLRQSLQVGTRRVRRQALR